MTAITPARMVELFALKIGHARTFADAEETYWMARGFLDGAFEDGFFSDREALALLSALDAALASARTYHEFFTHA